MNCGAVATCEPLTDTSVAVPSEVPPLVHAVGLERGPQTENTTLPVGAGTPLPVTVALSLAVAPSWSVPGVAVALVKEGPWTMKQPLEAVPVDGL